LVGLIDRVASLSANGIRATSKPAIASGSRSYDVWPVYSMLAPREVARRVDLGHRADEPDRPVRQVPREVGQQLEVEALVDDADVAGHLALARLAQCPRAGVVSRLDAAREQVHVVPPLRAHGAVQRPAAGEDDVRLG
jgi:hypothetical protein